MRLRLVEIVSDMLADCSGTPEDAALAAHALVGAAEAVADWVVDHPDADVDRAAERLMATPGSGCAPPCPATARSPARGAPMRTRGRRTAVRELGRSTPMTVWLGPRRRRFPLDVREGCEQSRAARGVRAPRPA